MRITGYIIPMMVQEKESFIHMLLIRKRGISLMMEILNTVSCPWKICWKGQESTRLFTEQTREEES